MRERVLIDNDVLLKIAAWRLEDALLVATTTSAGLPAMLGVARFVVGRRLRRRGLADPVAAAVLVLQEELLDATTASAVAAAKAKALAAGVPLATVQATIASVRPQPAVSVPSAVQAQAKVQKSVSTGAQTVGGSTRSSGGGIPAGGTSAGATGSTYNYARHVFLCQPPLARRLFCARAAHTALD